MKQIQAILQPHAVSRVLKALHDCEHFPGVTVSDCQGESRGKGPGGHYLPSPDALFLKDKKLLQIFCSDAVCDHLVEEIRRAAHTGTPGDGMITVSDLARVIRIHSGEEQENAV